MNEPEEFSQEDLIRIALESVSTREQAVDLINGKFADAYLTKIILDLEAKRTVSIMITSILKSSILKVYCLSGFNTGLKKIAIYEQTEVMIQDMLKALKEGGQDKSLADRVGRTLFRAFTNESLANAHQALDIGKPDVLEAGIRKAIVAETKVQNFNLEIISEKISSLYFRVNNPFEGVLPEIVSPFAVQAQGSNTGFMKSVSASLTSTEIAINDLLTNYATIIKCSTVISPMGGIDMDFLREGNLILFKLPFKTQDEKAIARKLDGVDEKGFPKPIVGKFKKMIIGPKNEYHIFAEGPKGVLLRSLEERKIRVATPKNNSAQRKFEDDSNTSKSFMYVLIGFVIFVIVIGIFFLVN
ncbi:MAG: hypothetical protein SFU98_07540 [Leptospiraceae bacterium]|nr:hypothetical protein [Leptospiraceae bacterium]